MHEALNHSHSGLRWVLLILLVAAIVVSFLNRSKATIEKKQKLTYLLALVFSHVQLLIGLALYFIYSGKVVFSNATMSDSVARFFTVEHLFGMLVAIALITIGYSKGKKAQSHSKVFWYYLVALVLIFASIPWPFRAELGVSTWF